MWNLINVCSKTDKFSNFYGHENFTIDSIRDMRQKHTYELTPKLNVLLGENLS
jgi:hypothetical protein